MCHSHVSFRFVLCCVLRFCNDMHLTRLPLPFPFLFIFSFVGFRSAEILSSAYTVRLSREKWRKCMACRVPSICTIKHLNDRQKLSHSFIIFRCFHGKGNSLNSTFQIVKSLKHFYNITQTCNARGEVVQLNGFMSLIFRPPFVPPYQYIYNNALALSNFVANFAFLGNHQLLASNWVWLSKRQWPH